MVDVPTFEAFYAAMHGRAPLPWQSRLAAMAAAGDWPDEVGVPTGLGKTACLDIAVWALAAQAEWAPADRTAPTRTWYVVDRRLLVDAAYDHGLDMARRLGEATTGPLYEVADALRRVAGGSRSSDPLHVVRLRGAAELGARPPHPAQPALCFSTVAMYASRWLFRGYGTSDRMRPVDAALAGTDALVLLDEAHLAPALVELAGPATLCDVGDPSTLLPTARARPRLVALTATGNAKRRFDLDCEDHQHPIVRQRLDAAKPVELVQSTRKKLPEALAQTAARLMAAGQEPRTCLIFTNTTATAGAVASQLQEQDAQVVVLTGRLRSREADLVREVLLAEDGVRAGRPNRPRSRPLFVVATQTLEVGADLDADHLVTETAGVRALTQRFGRLNRLGVRAHATAAIVHMVDQSVPWPVYDEEPAAVWQRLQAAAVNGSVHLEPRNVAVVLGEPADQPPRVPALLPAHLWDWAKTSLAPHGEAPVEPFFSGIDENAPRVSVAWRAWRPEPGHRCVPSVSQQESVEVPIQVARELLESRGEDLKPLRLGADGTTVEAVAATTLRPGNTLLLPAQKGGYDPTVGFDATARAEVLDVSLLIRQEIPLCAEILRHLAPGVSASALRQALAPLEPQAEEPVTDRGRREAAEAAAKLLSQAEPRPELRDDEWAGIEAGLRTATVAVPQPGAMPVAQWRRRRGTDGQVSADAFDDLTFDAASAQLNDHCTAVGDFAAHFARTLGLPGTLEQALRIAGQLHDLGKADVRFQRWLAPSGATGLLAKSGSTNRQRARIAAGWPEGGRHEMLSARLLDTAFAEGMTVGAEVDVELVRHLVVSHHGHGRPSIRAVADPFATMLTVDVLGTTVTVSGDLAVDDWGQPARFRRLCEAYGYWGLALLEAVLRQADHVASQIAEVA